MIKITAPIYVLLLFSLHVCLAAYEPQIIKFLSDTDTCGIYQPVFLDIDIKAPFENPYDPDDIGIEIIVSNAENILYKQPAFYVKGDNNHSEWQGRITFLKPGLYKVKATLIKNGRQTESEIIEIKAATSVEKGFIRKDPGSNFYFRFDSGELFRGIGENVCWADNNENYEYYFKKLSANNCNIARIWMCQWNFPLEWKSPGLGKYNTTAAKGIDSLLMLAEKYNIYLMLCFDYHGVLLRYAGAHNENKWIDNPYNAKNGGPCEDQADFFRNASAKQYYKNRLRYIVGRWAYHPHIQAWEFWNEVDLTAGEKDDIINWHKEMSDYLQSIDPYDHLITSSFSGYGYPDMWKLKNLDFSQTHTYDAPDIPTVIRQMIGMNSPVFNKPHVVGEYGINYRGPKETLQDDPEHIGFHNGLWAGFFAETPVIPLTWWWNNVIDPCDLYYQFGTLAKFGENILGEGLSVIARDSLPMILSAKESTENPDLEIFPVKGYYPNDATIYLIHEDGYIKNSGAIPKYIFGTDKPEMRNPPVFTADYKEDGYFALWVETISDSAIVRIDVDDKPVLSACFTPGQGQKLWKSINYIEEHNVYQAVYDTVLRIPVKKGRHNITVRNDGLDWIRIRSYHFENIGIKTNRLMDIAGIRKDSDQFFWIKNKGFNWKKVKSSGWPDAVKKAYLIINTLEKGSTYHYELWDTFRGVILKRNTIIVEDREVSIPLPDVAKDIACKFIKIAR